MTIITVREQSAHSCYVLTILTNNISPTTILILMQFVKERNIILIYNSNPYGWTAHNTSMIRHQQAIVKNTITDPT